MTYIASRAGRLSGQLEEDTALKTFVIGLALGAALVAFAGLASASIPDPAGLVHTCVNRNSGEWKVIDSAIAGCKANEMLLKLNQTGPKGDKGDKGDPGSPSIFNGTFTSPNGQFSLKVTDTGIVLSGPNNNTNVNVGASSVTVNGITVDINANVSATLRGGTTQIGCAPGGGVPVARLGSLVSVDPDSGIGSVIAGSPTVTAC
jgi:hypothetical protein